MNTRSFGCILRRTDGGADFLYIAVLDSGSVNPPLTVRINDAEFHLCREQREARGYWAYQQVPLGCPIDTTAHRGI